MLHYDALATIQPVKGATAQQLWQQAVERLVHITKTYPAKYLAFDKQFYKFPSYLRRDAITTVISKIFAYHAELADWEKRGRQRKRSFLNRKQDVMPCFYRKNTFLQNRTDIDIKLYNGFEWVWHTLRIRSSDYRYALKYISGQKSYKARLVSHIIQKSCYLGISDDLFL